MFLALRTGPYHIFSYSGSERPHISTTSSCIYFSKGRVLEENDYPQNVDLPPVLPINKKKPFPIPMKVLRKAGRLDKKLKKMGIEKVLEPPKNGLLAAELIPVAYEVLDYWKLLITGVAQLMQVVPVYACRECPQVHVASIGHRIRDCQGRYRRYRRSQHAWVKGSISDVLVPVECYHVFDPYGPRISHLQRLKYDRVRAIIELCIQAGFECPKYPSRRRIRPIHAMGKKIIDRGGRVKEPPLPKFCDSPEVMSEYDTIDVSMPPPAPSEVPRIAEETLHAFGIVSEGVRKLMSKYWVRACGYCPEIHVGPWGHNVRLCGAAKHENRHGKHGWQAATVDDLFPPNYVWHVSDPKLCPLKNKLKDFYGKSPAIVEMCVQAGAQIPPEYKPMMRPDVVIPKCKEVDEVA